MIYIYIDYICMICNYITKPMCLAGRSSLAAPVCMRYICMWHLSITSV